MSLGLDSPNPRKDEAAVGSLLWAQALSGTPDSALHTATASGHLGFSDFRLLELPKMEFRGAIVAQVEVETHYFRTP